MAVGVRAARVIVGNARAGRVICVCVRTNRGIVFSVQAARVVGAVILAALVLVEVVNFGDLPPGDPVNVAVVVDEVAPGKAAIQRLVVPQFGAAGGIGRIAGARVFSIRVGRRFFGDRTESPGAVVRTASRGQDGLSSRVAAERKNGWFTAV